MLHSSTLALSVSVLGDVTLNSRNGVIHVARVGLVGTANFDALAHENDIHVEFLDTRTAHSS